MVTLGTLHFAPAEDVRWMIKFLAPRIIQGRHGYMKRLNLYDDIFDHSKEVLTCILQGGEQLTRKAIYHALELENISTADQRGLQILWQLALEGLICFGPREGNNKHLY